jgi:hypothetical protein
MGQEFPMVSNRRPSRAGPADIARGYRGLLLWGAPLALLVIAPTLASAGRITGALEGTLVILGAAIFGVLCLANALRCGRTHCWIDGVGLPVLAVIGGLGAAGAFSVPWGTFLSTLWGVVLLSFLVECIFGPYLLGRPSRR